MEGACTKTAALWVDQADFGRKQIIGQTQGLENKQNEEQNAKKKRHYTVQMSWLLRATVSAKKRPFQFEWIWIKRISYKGQVWQKKNKKKNGFWMCWLPMWWPVSAVITRGQCVLVCQNCMFWHQILHCIYSLQTGGNTLPSNSPVPRKCHSAFQRFPDLCKFVRGCGDK